MIDNSKIAELARAVARFMSHDQGFGYSLELGFHTLTFPNGKATYTTIGRTLDDALVWFREWDRIAGEKVMERLEKMDFSEVYEI